MKHGYFAFYLAQNLLETVYYAALAGIGLILNHLTADLNYIRFLYFLSAYLNMLGIKRENLKYFLQH